MMLRRWIVTPLILCVFTNLHATTSYEALLPPGAKLVAGDPAKNEFYIIGPDFKSDAPAAPKQHIPAPAAIAAKVRHAVSIEPESTAYKKETMPSIAMGNLEMKQFAQTQTLHKKPFSNVAIRVAMPSASHPLAFKPAVKKPPAFAFNKPVFKREVQCKVHAKLKPQHVAITKITKHERQKVVAIKNNKPALKTKVALKTNVHKKPLITAMHPNKQSKKHLVAVIKPHKQIHPVFAVAHTKKHLALVKPKHPVLANKPVKNKLAIALHRPKQSTISNKHHLAAQSVKHVRVAHIKLRAKSRMS